jgi:hypothetical protein
MSNTDIHGPHTHGGRQQTIHYHLQNDRFKDEIPSRTEVEFLQRRIDAQKAFDANTVRTEPTAGETSSIPQLFGGQAALGNLDPAAQANAMTGAVQRVLGTNVSQGPFADFEGGYEGGNIPVAAPNVMDVRDSGITFNAPIPLGTASDVNQLTMSPDAMIDTSGTLSGQQLQDALIGRQEFVNELARERTRQIIADAEGQPMYGPREPAPVGARAMDDVMIGTSRQSLNPNLIFNPETGTYSSRTGAEIIGDRGGFYNPYLFNPNNPTGAAAIEAAAQAQQAQAAQQALSGNVAYTESGDERFDIFAPQVSTDNINTKSPITGNYIYSISDWVRSNPDATKAEKEAVRKARLKDKEETDKKRLANVGVDVSKEDKAVLVKQQEDEQKIIEQSLTNELQLNEGQTVDATAVDVADAVIDTGPARVTQNELAKARQEFDETGILPEGYTYQAGQIFPTREGRVVAEQISTTPVTPSDVTTTETATAPTTSTAPTTTTGVGTTGAVVPPVVPPVATTVDPSVAASQSYDTMIGTSSVDPYLQTLDPFAQYQQFRARQLAGAPISVLASSDYSTGYSPVRGRYLLGAASGTLPSGVTSYEENPAFAEYLQGGQQRQLADVRQSYAGLQDYLANLAGNQLGNLDLGYNLTYGNVPDRSQIIQSSLAALGGRGLGSRGERNLGTLYDLFQTQYGAQGASRFADMVGSAFGAPTQAPMITTQPLEFQYG